MSNAMRFNAGKVRLSYIPLSALEDCAKVFTFGAAKYEDNNWEKGLPWTEVLDSMLRHMMAWQAGEDIDPESGLPHLGHAMCNLVMLSRFKDTHPELDNRYKPDAKAIPSFPNEGEYTTLQTNYKHKDWS